VVGKENINSAFISLNTGLSARVKLLCDYKNSQVQISATITLHLARRVPWQVGQR